MADDTATRAAAVAIYLGGTNPARLLGGPTITNDPSRLTVQVTVSGIPASTRLVVYPTLQHRIGDPVSFQAGTLTPSVTFRLPLGLSEVGAAVDTPDLPRVSTFAAISPTIPVYELPAPINGVTVSELGSADIARLQASGFKFGFIDGTKSVDLIDGSITVGSSSRQAGLQRLYLGLLGRSGDGKGLGQYDRLLASGVGLAQVADQILAGPEYATSHGRPTDAQFVTSLYDVFRTTPPDARALAATAARLTAGESRGLLAADFASGSEALVRYADSTQTVFTRDEFATVVNQVYLGAFGRMAEAGGLTTYKAYLSTGNTVASFASVIAASPEFTGLHAGQSTMDFVTSLYVGALNRQPDRPGLANYVTKLDLSQVSRATVVLAIATSDEAATRLPIAL